MMTLYDEFKDNKIPMNFGFYQAFQQNEGECRHSRSAGPTINMNLAEEFFKMTQVKFEPGMATTMDERDSQLALVQALNGYYEEISASYRY